MAVECKVCSMYEGQPGRGAPCHPCPEMPNMEVLPGCYGTAVHGEYACTCRDETDEGSPKRRIADMDKRLAALEREVFADTDEGETDE